MSSIKVLLLIFSVSYALTNCGTSGDDSAATPNPDVLDPQLLIQDQDDTNQSQPEQPFTHTLLPMEKDYNVVDFESLGPQRAANASWLGWEISDTHRFSDDDKTYDSNWNIRFHTLGLTTAKATTSLNGEVFEHLTLPIVESESSDVVKIYRHEVNGLLVTQRLELRHDRLLGICDVEYFRDSTDRVYETKEGGNPIVYRKEDCPKMARSLDHEINYAQPAWQLYGNALDKNELGFLPGIEEDREAWVIARVLRWEAHNPLIRLVKGTRTHAEMEFNLDLTESDATRLVYEYKSDKWAASATFSKHISGPDAGSCSFFYQDSTFVGPVTLEGDCSNWN